MGTSKNIQRKVKEISVKRAIKTKAHKKLKKIGTVKPKENSTSDVKLKAIPKITKLPVLPNTTTVSKSHGLIKKSLLKKSKKHETENQDLENGNDVLKDVKEHVSKVAAEDVKCMSESKPNLKRKRATAGKQATAEKTAKDIDNKSEEKQNVGEKGTSDIPALKSQKKQKMNVKNAEAKLNISKDLSKDHILQCITAIFHLTEEQLKSKNALFDGESHPIFMQVTCIRVPKTPKRQMRMLLPHSILSPSDEVALFVCDMQRGRRKDFEPTVEHYEELLKEHGVTSINTVIPMNQVKTEYDQFELKKGLVSSYDHFLVDGRIAGHISHLLGSHFYKKRKLPTSIRMQSKDLKHEIEHALKKTSMQLHSNGDSHIVQVGSTCMNKDELAENILSVCSSLAVNYPGGWDNIRALRIKTPTSIAIPIYVTLKNKNAVPVPVVQPRRPKAYRDVMGTLSTLTSKAKVTVTPEGDVIIKKMPRKPGQVITQEMVDEEVAI